MEYFELASGDKMPALGLGTWRLRGDACTKAVTTALELGYEHIDTADAYGNHRAVGRALQDFDPDKIFIVSKIPKSDLHHEDALEVGERALIELGIETLDLLLIHWPNERIPVQETLVAMADLVRRGKVRNIGVSNFAIDHLEEALEVTEAPIAVNQVEFHPYNNQKRLLAYCKDHDIVVTAYSPFGSGNLIRDRDLAQIARKYNRTVPQVILRWLLTKGLVVIPKSGSPEHMKDNLDIFDWELDRADFDTIEALDRR
jgi:2,5-diketo-D-gluconate reductase B